MDTLQSLVLPNLQVPATEDMSVRLNDRAWARLDAGCVEFDTGGTVSTDTFYNGLSVGAWRRHCALATLSLLVAGVGDFVLRIGLHRSGQDSVWLAEHGFSLAEGAPVDVPLPAWPTLVDGLLFWTLRARRPGRLDGAAWVTADAPRQPVRLGIVITHFNRQQQVLPAIERLRATLLQRPDLQPHITLTVVDNSSNLGLEPGPGVEVITSRNLGGTGGFMRGLLALKDGGAHSHALFMDDDASCEADAIARTFALLRHATDPTLAVCGALLREAAPWQLLEKGARFDGQVRPLAAGLDMRRVDHLLQAERPTVRPDYGAWWFFAFPIGEVKAWPFPFFVRGDDIHFGLANRFRIATLNGVACLGEDFSVKHSPMTAYLDARYHLVLALLAGGRGARSGISWVASRLFIKQLSAYHYSSARAVALAVRHVLQGPGFFDEHIDLQAVRSEMATWQPDEKLRPIDRTAYQVRPPRAGREPRLRRLLRLLTLQGFLLPDALLKNRMTLQDKAFHGRAGAVFRYRSVLYEHQPSGTGYVAVYDRARFFAELRAFVTLWRQLRRRLPELQAAYAEGAAGYAREAYWRAVHQLPGPDPDPAPATPGDADA